MVSRRSTRSHQTGSLTLELEENMPNLEEDELDEEEDEVEEVTRCICGNPELQISPSNPDFDDVDPGFFIQCEECQVWQHGYCVGIKDEVDAPDKYWCELCKPELHTLVYKGPKVRRSLYTPVTEKKKKANSKKIKEEKEDTKKVITKPSTASSPISASSNAQPLAVATKNKHSSSPEARHRRERSRGTLNSRDAEYELLLKKALEESAKESGVQPEDPELSEHTRERSTRRTRNEDSLKREDESDHEITGNENTEQSELDSKNLDTKQDNKRRRLDVLDQERAKAMTPSTSTTVDSTLIEGEEEKNPSLTVTANVVTTLNEMSDNDSSSVSKANTSNKKKRPRRAAASTSKAVSQNKNSSPRRPKSKEDIDADKPTKPRLPQQRISMYEMRRRTSAILEFLVRTQSELKYEFENGADITEFIDDTTGNSELNKDDIKLNLKKGYNESVTLMENLTSKIIDWNTKFGESE